MIEYATTHEGIIPEQLVGFFVGWPNPPAPETHLELLRRSTHCVVARDVDAGNRVVGFITAISDGVLAAYIPLLEVLPAYQGQGIGSELVRLMLVRLRDLYMVDVTCDADVVPFYARFGLRQAGAMVLRNYARQSAESD